MSDHDWPSPTPRDEMLGRVVARGRHLMLINRILIGVAVAAVVGAAVGFGLGVTGTVDVLADDQATVSLDGVALRHCPGGDTVGQLRRGDRVLLTGIDESGDWLQLRSPYDASGRVWIRHDLAVPDHAIDDLPVRDCGIDEYALTLPDGEQVEVTTTTTTPPDESTTTTTEPDGEETTTTTAGQGPTTTQGPGTTTTTKAPATTTTQPPDNTSPMIGPISRNPALIWEDNPSPGVCPANSPRTSAISATITDSGTGVASATMQWTVRDANQVVRATGSKPMARSGNTWSATLGPFAENVLPALSADGVISVRIVALDGNQNFDDRSTTVALRDCSFG